jgi:hypothetical protein
VRAKSSIELFTELKRIPLHQKKKTVSNYLSLFLNYSTKKLDFMRKIKDHPNIGNQNGLDIEQQL